MENKVKKIVHVISYYPPHIGGMELRVRDLATRQAKCGMDVAVLTSDIGGKSGEFFEEGVKVIRLRSFEFAHTPIFFGLFWKLFKISKDSVIHLHVAQSFSPEIVAIIAAMRKMPFIAHIRCIVTSSGIMGVLLPLYRNLILKNVLRRAAKIIVLAPEYKKIMNEQFGIPEKSVAVIPNATTFKVASKPKTLSGKLIKILAVGRIANQKNYPFMMDSLSLYKKKYSADFVLKIVGGGENLEQLKKTAKGLGLESNVDFWGEITGQRLEEIYEQNDLFIHTSITEGFCTVFIEAMAKGLPIVATDIAGTRDVVMNGRNGLLVDFVPEEFCRALNRMITDSAFYETVSRNNLEDIKKYNWDSIVEITQKIYDSVK
jgi:glycosyltransferase involved in cell wall biosynthesis